MLGSYPNEFLLDIARTVDDLVHSIDKGSNTLISRNIRAPN